MTTTDLAPYDFRDAGTIIAEVALREPLHAGDVRVALVQNPSTDQDLVAVADLPAEEWQGLDRGGLSQYLARKVEPFDVPAWDGHAPRHATLTIVARRGFTVFGPEEGRWLEAWHYCHHFKHMFTASLVVVTEHGWFEFMSGVAATAPSLAPDNL